MMTTEVKEYTLDNGLTVWLNEDHSQPRVFGAVVVKAGSKESPNTGIAHYFEHMMFKGTDKIGTVDYKSERRYLDLIARKYDELAATSDDALRRSIQQEINELSVQAAHYVIPNEFDKLITKYGGSKLNAGTSYDYTVYHSIFTPQYMTHWAEINSERLLNPVFRMFQNELETVCEEKNRHDDMMLNRAIERVMHIFFYPHPYAWPIIGSVDSLKNPRLSEMRKFFRKYYVASNMGLIMSGDFDMERTLPVLERTFSRIPKGVVIPLPRTKIPPLRGREKAIVKIPVPLMKAVALGFRGVPSNHPDREALDIAVGILNNSNGTGYLDKLMVERRLTGAMAGGESFNEAGFIGIVVVPRLVLQSCRTAEKLIWKQIERLKNGDFTEEIFNSLKRERLRTHLSSLEDVDSRSQILVHLFAQGKKWSDYLDEMERIDMLTKNDIVRIAGKYFGDNYLFVKKKTGQYRKENLAKPGFAPILPKHKDATSAYARQLEEIPVPEVNIRFLDFENDVQTRMLTPRVTLYTTPNRMNQIFTLKLSYGIGLLQEPRLKFLAAYLPLLGAGSLSFEDFRTRLQSLGSMLEEDVDNHSFTLKISGFDRAFVETLTIVKDFLLHVKADSRKMKTLVDDARVMEKTFFQSNSEVAEALFEYVQFGKLSQYMTKLSFREVKWLGGKELVELFHRVQRTECSLHYCGTLDEDEAARHIRTFLPLDEICEASTSPLYREFVKYDRPLVFFYNMPDVFQNIIYAYMSCEPLDTLRKRHEAELFSRYFGEGMSSLMFQEIREFRSLAYYTSGAYRMPPFCHAGMPARFVTYLSTQCDKTTDALEVLNMLIQDMPERPERIAEVIQTVINRTNNDYPSFRDLSARIAAHRRNGYAADPNRQLIEDIKTMTMSDIARFYRANVRGRTLVYVVVGNSRLMDMQRLATFGDIVRMKKSDFYH
ncbi:MAG: insulinase family protein [Tannerella sp.]|jgi:predicted Zn-dependent peptidase|nr:insulinase family protein [Tannerella sp.]